MKEKKEGREGRTSEIDLDDEWGWGGVQEGDDGFRFARVGAEGLSKYEIDRRTQRGKIRKAKQEDQSAVALLRIAHTPTSLVSSPQLALPPPGSTLVTGLTLLKMTSGYLVSM